MKNTHKQFSSKSVNPYAAEMFVSIFHLFEAGIADAISSFEWQKIFICRKNDICHIELLN